MPVLLIHCCIVPFIGRGCEDGGPVLDPSLDHAISSVSLVHHQNLVSTERVSLFDYCTLYQ